MISDLNYVRNVNFPNRYISPEKLFSYLQANYAEQISQIGNSTLGLPIYLFSIGTGTTKVLSWSQMHGNESNATHAMLDLLISLTPEQAKDLFSKISLDFIFMLNPDGSKAWTRRNAMEIDMNRDFLKESTVEMRLLKKIAFAKKYDYALNLHEQRTIFSSDSENPATLAFLAPSEDYERTITNNRKKSMAVIAKIYEAMQKHIPKQIARYSDEFYPTSSGDNFMKSGIPVILYEGGHFPNDYQREGTRKYYTIALYEGLKAIAELKGSTNGFEKYNEIPENKETHYDIIYKNVSLKTDFPCVLDIAVQFKETYTEGKDDIDFIPFVAEVGDLGRKKGWKEIDCTDKEFICERKFPKLDAMVDFEIK